MVRNYKKKSNRSSWSEEALVKAIAEIKQNAGLKYMISHV